MHTPLPNLVLCLLLTVCGSARAELPPPVPQFQDGDRVCFVGDSITHGGSYHSLVYLYYLTRFPNREIRIWNKGISGNQAHDVLRRFDQDIAAAKPTVSTLMLGMNDVGRWLYGRDKTDDAVQQKQQEQLNRYYKNMAILLGKFEMIDSEVVFITPSIYDQTAALKAHNDFGVNDGLGRCAAFVAQVAAARGQGVVDFYDAMGAINVQVQREDPSATIVGPDRVHPAADPGHVIMSYQFLKAQQVPQYVAKMVLDAKAGTVLKAENCSISDLVSDADSLSFTALEAALPYPQTDAVRQGLALVPFEQEMNQEILSIQHLGDGDYILSIDGAVVGTWSSAQFAEGINLAVIEATPQYQQSLKVKTLNDTRHYQQGRLRNAAFTYYNSGLCEADIDREDPDAVQAFLAAKLKEVEGKSWHGYFKDNFEAYARIKAQSDTIRAELDSLHAKLYQANQPVPHRFTLTHVREEEYAAIIGLQLPSIFSDHMMLQRDKPVRIWGKADPGARITVEFTSQKKETVASAIGEWQLDLDPLPASAEPRTLTVRSSMETRNAELGTRDITNILVGDVWISSGQSNMEFPLFKSTHGAEVLKQPANPSVRFFKQRFDGAPEPRFDCKEGHWKTDEPEARKWISAVAWNFIQEIYQSEHVPVALVQAFIGGSSAQMWTPIKDLRADEAFQFYVKRYEAYASNFDERKSSYPRRKAEAEAAGKEFPITEHYGWFPSATYNAMLHPIQKFVVKGVVWYQGEANTDPFQAKLYRKLFPAIIEAWRREMQAPALPFLFVQLPNFDAPEGRDWATLRESQALTADQVKHTGMVVTIDLGDSGDVHPKTKKPVGERLARIALHQVYGRPLDHAAPTVGRVEAAGTALRLHFDGAVLAKDGEPLREFTVCGEDQNFVPADGVITGATVVVSSVEVPKPVAVRYAWRNDPHVNLFGQKGLPVAPFRSDSFEPGDNEKTQTTKGDAEMKKSLIAAAAAVAIGTNVLAADVSTFNPTLKQVNMYGGEYTKGEIVASEDDGALKFAFTGEPAMDKHQKAIQIYCKVWDLKPGNYTLALQMKGNQEKLQFPICLNGTLKGDDKTVVKLGDYIAPVVGGEWTDISLPVTIVKNTLHGRLMMRVGAIPKDSEIYLKQKFTLTPAK